MTIKELIIDLVKCKKNKIVYLINVTQDIPKKLKKMNINYKIIKQSNNMNKNDTININIYKDLFDIVDKPNTQIYIICDCAGDTKLYDFLTILCEELTISHYITDSIFKTTSICIF
jgi:hypothetical protein